MTGWIAQFEQNPIEVGAYGTATATLKLTAPSNASPDIYTVKVEASDDDNKDVIGSAETFVSVECKRENPVLSISSSISPTQETILPGDKVTYWISVSNPEIGGCGARNYIVSAVVPPVWVANPPQSAIAVEGGSSGTVQFEIGCPEYADNGNYSLVFIVSDPENFLISETVGAEVVVYKPTPTPVPTPTEPATATVEKLEIYSENLQKGRLVLKKGESASVTVTALSSSGRSDVPVPNVSVIAKAKFIKIKMTGGKRKLTDKRGQAVFNVRAKRRGRCFLSFAAQDVTDGLMVSVK